MARRSDADYEDQGANVKCRLRCMLRRIACFLEGAIPFAPLSTSILASNGEKQSWGEVYAFSEMAYHVEIAAEFCTIFGCERYPSLGSKVATVLPRIFPVGRW